MQWIGIWRTRLRPVRPLNSWLWPPDLDPLTLTCNGSYVLDFVTHDDWRIPRPQEASMTQPQAVITLSPPALWWRNRVAPNFGPARAYTALWWRSHLRKPVRFDDATGRRMQLPAISPSPSLWWRSSNGKWSPDSRTLRLILSELSTRGFWNSNY